MTVIDEIRDYMKRTGTYSTVIWDAAQLSRSYLARAFGGKSVGPDGAAKLRAVMKAHPEGIGTWRQRVPENLQELCNAHPHDKLAEMLGISSATLTKYRRYKNITSTAHKPGLKAGSVKPAKVEFWTEERLSAIQKMLARGWSYETIAGEIGVSLSAVARKCQLLGWKKYVAPKPPKLPKPRKESKPFLRAAAPERSAVTRLPGKAVGQVPPVADGVAARAAQHLRRFYSNVFNGTVKGRQFAGLYFVSGKGMIRTSEMIKLAEKHGFKADNWMQIAA